MLEVKDSTFLMQGSLVPQFDLVCLSHLRWDFVYQRPQHLMSRCAQERRVFFIEEPIFDTGSAYLHVNHHQKGPQAGLWVIVPHLPDVLSEEEINQIQRQMLDDLFSKCEINSYVLWYYTPMALAFTWHLEPIAIVYDCMDELSFFKNASPQIKHREAQLFDYADLVFTGGYSLYEAKRYQHAQVYAFPSSVDTSHFARAREMIGEPPDQVSIPHPRLGFYGVIDERMDIDLLSEIADAQPNWHLILIGPTTKIDPAVLPQGKNIHYLGAKSYNDLPTYLSGWDVALVPFARNEATRFISPTKTLEYLAGGKPVVSTSIADVVYPYGQQGLVAIADTASDFIAAIIKAMSDHRECLHKVDTLLSQTSWDFTWANMRRLIEDIVASRHDWLLYSVASTSVIPSTLSVSEEKSSIEGFA